MHEADHKSNAAPLLIESSSVKSSMQVQIASEWNERPNLELVERMSNQQQSSYKDNQASSFSLMSASMFGHPCSDIP
jgi:hypothetical protein